ncbi:MAG: MBOAT family O-acyltransferase [Myxococcota bacterium]
MLFNSYAYLVFFLPITFGLCWLASRTGGRWAVIATLTAASLFFYGWWDPRYLALLLGSVVVNFALGEVLHRRTPHRRAWLAAGVAANLAAIGWYKYAGFLAGNAEALFGGRWSIPEVALPLAISFFTFQQIAYLVDVYRGEAPRYDPLRYALFVTFFPQLIAGPIVRHQETIPQLGLERDASLVRSDLAVGLSILLLGLFKKVVLADSFAVWATPVFDAAARGASPGALEAWGAALSYSFQLYFDFSGYCDMAIGSARLFGVKLPANFESPYRATSIIDFWRRWHMTLSRFLRDYLYIPLGGSRRGTGRRYLNLLVTMLLGGLWHGAGWTFVLWGGLHGLLLVVNHGWRAVRGRREGGGRVFAAPLGWLFTFVSVVFAWVLFRAADLASAVAIYEGMLGRNGLGGQSPRLGGLEQVEWLILGFAVVLLLPTSQHWMSDWRPVLQHRDHADPEPTSALPLRWRPSPVWAVTVGLLGLVALTRLTRVSEFLYFQF